MISFYPGPSKLYPQVYAYMQDAMDHGVFSLNHRSSEFTAILKSAVLGMRDRLEVPEHYLVCFVSSATECWEIIAQSFIEKASFHCFNGAFGKKWHDYTNRLVDTVHSHTFDLNAPLSPDVKIPASAEVICLTQNETSNGTAVSPDTLKKLKKLHPTKLIAIDATSSLAGIHLDFTSADIWYASVQKCFGLPTGMAVLICSPQAVERGLELNEDGHYNSFLNLHRNAIKWQTTHTPNTMNIYLLKRLMETLPPINEINDVIVSQSRQWYTFIEQNLSPLHPLISSSECRSDTVVAVEASEKQIDEVKNSARAENILLGRGYGEWLNRSFRIANFPAISQSEISLLQDFLLKKVKAL